MKKSFNLFILFSLLSYSVNAQAIDQIPDGIMFSKVDSVNGQQLIDYTFKFGDTIFQVRKYKEKIQMLKINGQVIAKKNYSIYLKRVTELIKIHDKESPLEQPNPQPRPQPNPNSLELVPVEKNGKIQYDDNKTSFYSSGNIRVYNANSYTIVKIKDEINKIYFKGNKIPEQKWQLLKVDIEKCIEKAIAK
jgi:hypothetical protein